MSEVWTRVTVCFSDEATAERWEKAFRLAGSDDWGAAREAFLTLGVACLLDDSNSAIRVSRLFRHQRRLEFSFMELGLDSSYLLNALMNLGATHLSASSDDSRTGHVTKTIRIGNDKVKEAEFVAAVAEFDDQYAFRLAVTKGKLTNVKRLLKRGISPNEPIRGSNYPIHYATISNKPKIIQALIDAGADPNVQTGETQYAFESFRTALHIALNSPVQRDVAKTLIDAGTDLSLKDGKGCTPLYLAIKDMDIELCKLMLARGADPAPVDASGLPALFSLESTKAEAIPAFLAFAKEAGLDLNIVSAEYGNLRWALGWLQPAADYLDRCGFHVIPAEGAYAGKPANVLEAAIRHHDHAKIEQLISTGIDLNVLPDPPERWPHWAVNPAISQAARHGATAIVQRLLDAGCNPNTPSSDGWRALHHAALEGNVEIVRLLLNAGADANAIIPDRGSSVYGRQPHDDPFLVAVDKSHLSVAEQLLGHWRPNNARLQRGKDQLRMLIDHKYIDASAGEDLLRKLESVSPAD